MAADSDSVWRLWKWCSVFFELSIVNEFLTTIGFWIFVYPYYPYQMYFLDYARHGLPFFFLAIDFHLNSSLIEARHYVASLFFMAMYQFNMVTFHLMSGSYVYRELLTFVEYFTFCVGA